MKKLLSLLVLTGTLFAQANNVFTLNPSVNSYEEVWVMLV